MTSGKQNTELYTPYRFFFPCQLLVPLGNPGRRKQENKLLMVIRPPCGSSFYYPILTVIPAQLGALHSSWFPLLEIRKIPVDDLPRSPCVPLLPKGVQAPRLALIGCQGRGSGFVATGTAWHEDEWEGFECRDSSRRQNRIDFMTTKVKTRLPRRE